VKNNTGGAMDLGHRKLKVWQEAVELVVDLYKMTDSFPKSETYGLTSQIRRAGVSVPCNIAEGAGRKSKKEFSHPLHISRGSPSELDTLMVIGEKLGYVPTSMIPEQCINKVFSLLSGLISSIEK
jgi:four helix bundle protein